MSTWKGSCLHQQTCTHSLPLTCDPHLPSEPEPPNTVLSLNEPESDMSFNPPSCRISLTDLSSLAWSSAMHAPFTADLSACVLLHCTAPPHENPLSGYTILSPSRTQLVE